MAKARILIVEDEAIIASVISGALRKFNYEVVDILNSGEAAVAAALDKKPDLILMDIRLPYEDGYGALKKIRASDRLKSIPIIAVTAEASTDQMNKARESGFDGFLGKPLDPDRFPDQIRRILSGEAVWEFS